MSSQRKIKLTYCVHAQKTKLSECRCNTSAWTFVPKSTAGNTASNRIPPCVQCKLTNHWGIVFAASGKIKRLYQKVWQRERPVASSEVSTLITLQRDWFGFSCRGWADESRSADEEEVEDGGRVWRWADGRATVWKEMEEFQFRFQSNTITTSASFAFATITPTSRGGARFTSARGVFLLQPSAALYCLYMSLISMWRDGFYRH